MASVYGNINLVISADVTSTSEKLGILQANYKICKERFVDFELYGINSRGEREKITVHDCESVSLEDYVE